MRKPIKQLSSVLSFYLVLHTLHFAVLFFHVFKVTYSTFHLEM